MLDTTSLSLDQAPPISIPFRFFLTAPLFAIAAGFLLLVFGEALFVSRWSALTLALTHLVTLGVLSMVMCGAMLQMLPVMAGSPVPRVVLVGSFTHFSLILGTVLLVIAFLTGNASTTLAALVALGVGFSIFIVAVGIALWRLVVPGATVQGMKLAVIALAATLLMGAVAAVGFSGIGRIEHLALVADAHLSWGMLGWVGLLLLSVSFQLVPMFQITPEYPAWLRHHLAYSILACLVIWLLLKVGFGASEWTDLSAQLLLMMVVLGYVIFSLKTLQLQYLRKRRVPDVTLLFWRLGMLTLAGCALLWASGLLFPVLADAQFFSILLGIGLIQGVALSVINGMLYKIVPFLSWFHLQNRQMAVMCLTVRIPHMKEFLTDKAAKRQFYLHLSALVVTGAASIVPVWFSRLAALLFIASNLMLLFNLVAAVGRFRAAFKLLVPPLPIPSAKDAGTG